MGIMIEKIEVRTLLCDCGCYEVGTMATFDDIHSAQQYVNENSKNIWGDPLSYFDRPWISSAGVYHG